MIVVLITDASAEYATLTCTGVQINRARVDAFASEGLLIVVGGGGGGGGGLRDDDNGPCYFYILFIAAVSGLR